MGSRVPIKWDRYNGGEIHSFTHGELRELLNSDIDGFRARVGVVCRRKGWAHATRTELVGDTIVFQFCISTDGVKPDLPRLPGRHPGRQGALGRHRDCTHANSKADRERCRHAQQPEVRRRRRQKHVEARARLAQEKAISEALAAWLPGLRRLERAALVAPTGEYIRTHKSAIAQRERIRRTQSREFVYAKWGDPKEAWDPIWFRGGPSVYQLASFLLVRSKNDRKYKGFHRFSMDWVRSHYPYLLANSPELVHDALQILTLRGHIKWL